MSDIIITSNKGVSIEDVKNVLGENTNLKGVSAVCLSNKINKWARYKPIIVANEVGQLTYEQYSNAKFGLVPAENTLLWTKNTSSDGGSKVADADDLEAVFAANTEWIYRRPTGTMTAPFRLSDFGNPKTNGASYGYYHLTPPPVERVGSWAFNLSSVNKCANNTALDYNPGNTVGGWQLIDANNTSPLYSNLAFRYGDDSQYNVNSASTYAIPLPFLLGMQSSDNWRLAVAVQVPVNGAFDYMQIFTSKSTFYVAQGVGSSAAAQHVMPSLGTNQYLCKLIKDHADYLATMSANKDVLGNKKTTSVNPVFSLPACLCVVKDIYMERIGRQTKQSFYTHCYLTSLSKAYSAPAIISRFEIVINDDVNFSASEGEAYRLVSISLEHTDQYAQMGDATSNRVYVNKIMLKQLLPVTEDKTVYYKVRYSYVIFDGTTPSTVENTLTGDVTLIADAEEGSSDWKDYALIGAPGAYILKKQQDMLPIQST